MGGAEGGGGLGERLGLGPGAVLRLSLPLPATVTQALTTAEAQHPAAAGWLVRAGLPLPAVYRAGQRLSGGAQLAPGDVLDLVLVIAGG